MDSPEEEKLRKQKYLKEQIMENESYDVDNFIEYMANEKEGGEDVDNWTFSELREAVHRYQQKKELIDSYIFLFFFIFIFGFKSFLFFNRNENQILLNIIFRI